MTKRSELIAELRLLVLNYNGPLTKSPYYNQLTQLLVSECMIG
jgi:hypothetical protein